MPKYFDTSNNRVVFEGEPANAHHWDNLWHEQGDTENLLQTGGGDPLIRQLTTKFLKPSEDIKVVDAGCGKGQHVVALRAAGYDAYGVDYAPATVKHINNLRPDLKISVADVRDLPFENDYFDGMWSVGVIEHFFDGYQEITKEMQRVIKPGGYLFITFPHLSSLRKLKAKLDLYQQFNQENFDVNNFYQFALDDAQVVDHFKSLGFTLKLRRLNNGLKGMKDEMKPLEQALQKIYDSKMFPVQVLKVALSKATEPVANHTIALVLQKSSPDKK